MTRQISGCLRKELLSICKQAAMDSAHSWQGQPERDDDASLQNHQAIVM